MAGKSKKEGVEDCLERQEFGERLYFSPQLGMTYRVDGMFCEISHDYFSRKSKIARGIKNFLGFDNWKGDSERLLVSVVGLNPSCKGNSEKRAPVYGREIKLSYLHRLKINEHIDDKIAREDDYASSGKAIEEKERKFLRTQMEAKFGAIGAENERDNEIMMIVDRIEKLGRILMGPYVRSRPPPRKD